MTPELKQRWITALTDGFYQHTTGYLKSHNPDNFREVGHCCLGVLCELVGATIRSDGTDAIYQGDISAHEDGWYIPEVLAEELGITFGDQDRLADLNDAEKGPKFPQPVIDYIQDHF